MTSVDIAAWLDKNLNAWFTLTWLNKYVKLHGRQGNISIKGLDFGLTFYDSKFFCLGNMDCRVLYSLFLKTESYCISIRVILLWILKFAGTVEFKLFIAFLSFLSLRKSFVCLKAIWVNSQYWFYGRLN